MRAIFVEMEEHRLCVNDPKYKLEKKEEVIDVKLPEIKQEVINVDEEWFHALNYLIATFIIKKQLNLSLKSIIHQKIYDAIGTL